MIKALEGNEMQTEVLELFWGLLRDWVEVDRLSPEIWTLLRAVEVDESAPQVVFYRLHGNPAIVEHRLIQTWDMLRVGQERAFDSLMQGKGLDTVEELGDVVVRLRRLGVLWRSAVESGRAVRDWCFAMLPDREMERLFGRLV